MGYGITLKSDNPLAKPFYDSDTDIGKIRQVLDSFTISENSTLVKSYPVGVDLTKVLIHQSPPTGVTVYNIANYTILGQDITFDTTHITDPTTISIVVLL